MTTPAAPLMGFEGRAYVAAAGSTPTSELKEVRNLKISCTYTEVDTTVQGDHGVKTAGKGMQDFQLAFDLVISESPSTEAGLVLTAIHSRTPVAMHFVERASGSGPRGTFHVFGGDQTISGDDVQTSSCTAKPAFGYATPTKVSGPIEVNGITLSDSTATIAVNGTKALTATLSPAGASGTVTWSSSNSTVASVSNGTVTGNATGSATITATCDSYSATCTITVSGE